MEHSRLFDHLFEIDTDYNVECREEFKQRIENIFMLAVDAAVEDRLNELKETEDLKENRLSFEKEIARVLQRRYDIS